MQFYTGMDTLTYTVKDDAEPTQGMATARQIIRIDAQEGAINNTLAADDYVHTYADVAVTGNVKINDTDAEGNVQSVTPQNITVSGKGQFVLNADGTFSFTPENGFTGPLSFTYSTCDDGAPVACAGATVYIVVLPVVNPDLTPSTRITNGTFIEPLGTTRNFVIEVNEIYGNAIDNAIMPVRVRVFKSDNFDYSFVPTETSATVPAAITVNNPDWDLVQNTATVMIFELKSGSNIAGYGNSKINIRMQVLPGAAEGTENQTVSILNGSGVEADYTNNSIVRILNIVH
jgi:large repetitive protein